MKIALIGNPNSGKTAMFNTLTGENQRVGNWPGVTVEKKEGVVKKKNLTGLAESEDLRLIDLPGIYSLSPYTLEEIISRDFLLDEKPDVVINIVDASNIERNLYLTTQLLEIGIPVVIALNMMDLVKKKGESIDAAKLSAALGCEIIETVAIKGESSFEAAQIAINVFNSGVASPAKDDMFSADLEELIGRNRELLEEQNISDFLRYYSVRFTEGDPKVLERLGLSSNIVERSRSFAAALETKHEDDIESIIISQRYDYVEKITSEVLINRNASPQKTTEKIDKIVTNKFLALPIFALIMFGVYYIAMTGPGLFLTDWVNEVLFGEIVPGIVGNFLGAINAAPWIESLVQDGIIAGVGAVLGFLPQMFVLFILLNILEDCGYMSRIAFIMDKIFRKFGLSGKSIIPFLVTTGCGVPGVMATRTIENDKDRRMTAMLTNFMPCGAKMPIFALFAGALFGESAIIATSMYFISLLVIMISAFFLSKTKPFRGSRSTFIMELPVYHTPQVKSVIKTSLDQAKEFIFRAGTIIFVSSVIIWVMSHLTWGLKYVEEIDSSMLASIGNAVSFIFKPIGFGNWKAVVATITGLVAKENVVGTFGVLYGQAEVSEAGTEIWSLVAKDFTKVSAYSFMVFNLLCAPCFAAIGAVNAELKSKKWTAYSVILQTSVAYIVSFLIYQVGSLIF